jgi:hypothetical protein
LLHLAALLSESAGSMETGKASLEVEEEVVYPEDVA